MSESGDYTPAEWSKGETFKEARASYDRHAGRSYAQAVEEKKPDEALLPPSISTDSDEACMVGCDITGSMRDKPGIFFSKAPYLDHEVRTEYRGPTTVTSFCAFGDAHNRDRFPVQVRPFAKEKELLNRIKELVIVGGGGNGLCESAELLCLYWDRNVHMPNLRHRPVVVIITDEKPYDSITREMAKTVHVNLQEPLISTSDVIASLSAKYAFYVLLVRYDESSGWQSGRNREVHSTWRELVPDDHIALLDNPEDLMDSIRGIYAKETDRVDYFRKEIESRQPADRVASTYRALTGIHRDAGKKAGTRAGHSTLHRNITGKKVDDLI